MSATPEGRHRVVIVGGGFGGLYAARALGRERRVELTVVDRRNFHLFQPLRAILRRNRNTRVILGEAVGIDVERQEVRLRDGGVVGYDTLVVASGAHHSYFGNEAWARDAPGLKTIDDALEIRRRIFIAFEAAEREANDERRGEWMTFLIVGGGPTGVELAGALGEIANDTLRRDFRAINPADSRIVLVEALERVLPTYPEQQSASAQRQLERLGVRVRTGWRVVGIDERGVELEPAAGGERERLPTRTVLWAAGVQAASFGRKVAEATGAPADKAGRLVVGADLALAGHPEILAIGDAASITDARGRKVPGVAQGAIQSGKHAARTIRDRLAGRPTPAFGYRDRGEVAIIGRLAGVTDIGWLGPLGRRSGFPAWLLWLGIHIFYLIGFANRVVVIVRWAWSFITHGRGSRLITGQPLVPELEEPLEEPAEAPRVQSKG
ncbi:MAG TPA: NAD(P)/FAD-dependent oxidoreductase [Candidatus Limnocylindrales bacterium]